ncbi:hypothetical protein AGMMS49991_04070 [Spirochaetia bacterium]|nr:hypothetical protein AGMMS49991_04070 [Spirochaetia bacterium]
MGDEVTARAEIARLLAMFNDLSENKRDIVLKISEMALKPEIIPSVQAQAEDYAGMCRRHPDLGKHEPTL